MKRNLQALTSAWSATTKHKLNWILLVIYKHYTDVYWTAVAVVVCCFTCWINTIKCLTMFRLLQARTDLSLSKPMFVKSILLLSRSHAQKISEIGFVSGTAVYAIKTVFCYWLIFLWLMLLLFRLPLYFLPLSNIFGLLSERFCTMVGMTGQVHFLCVYGRKWSRGQ